jgi:hypothetical protein
MKATQERQQVKKKYKITPNMYHIKILIQNFIIIYFFVHVVWLSKRFTTPYINLRTYLNQQRNKKNKEKSNKIHNKN